MILTFHDGQHNAYLDSTAVFAISVNSNHVTILKTPSDDFAVPGVTPEDAAKMMGWVEGSPLAPVELKPAK
jgi:hypothetical protein